MECRQVEVLLELALKGDLAESLAGLVAHQSPLKVRLVLGLLHLQERLDIFLGLQEVRLLCDHEDLQSVLDRLLLVHRPRSSVAVLPHHIHNNII